MNRVPDGKAAELLNAAAREAEELSRTTEFSPRDSRFTVWRENTSGLVSSFFGDDSAEARSFRDIKFRHGAMTAPEDRRNFQSYKTGLIVASGLLDGMRGRIDAEKTPISANDPSTAAEMLATHSQLQQADMDRNAKATLAELKEQSESIGELIDQGKIPRGGLVVFERGGPVVAAQTRIVAPSTRPVDDDARPFTMFLGSSVEGKEVARAIQAELEHDRVESTIWYQGVFTAGGTAVRSLYEKARACDFATLVLTADDFLVKRDESGLCVRDNVLFELGLFIGALGPDRTFMMYNRDNKPLLPSDVVGVTPVNYPNRRDGNIRAAVGPACSDILAAMKKAGRR